MEKHNMDKNEEERGKKVYEELENRKRHKENRKDF